MKKIISMILCVLMLASFAAFAVYAEEAEPIDVAKEKATIIGKTASNEKFVVFDFTVDGQAAQGNSTQDSGYHMWWGKSKRFDCAYDADNQATKLIYTGVEGAASWYFTTCIPTTLQFNSNEFKYVKVLYKTSPTIEDDYFTSAFFFGLADTDPDEDGTSYYKGQWGPDFHAEWLDDYSDPCYYKNNGEWNEMVVDMSNNAFWEDEGGTKGYISELRYDITWGAAPEAGDYIEIKYIAILKTPEDAYKFGILEDGSFGLRDIEMPTEAEDTTAEETTAAETVADDTTVADTTAADTAEATTAASTVATEDTTKASNDKANKGCGNFIGTGVAVTIALLGACVLPKKKH